MLNLLLTDTTAAGGPEPNGSLLSSLFPLIMIGVLIFFFVSANKRQKKQEKAISDMRDALQVGDEITTIGGIIGKIVSIKEETVMIETGRDGTKIRILRSAVKCVDVKAEDC